jgi:hypothetical protein
MNKSKHLREVIISFPAESNLDLKKNHKMEKVIKKYYSNLFDYSNSYSENLLSGKTKHNKNKHPNFHFLLIPANKKSKKSKMEENHE